MGVAGQVSDQLLAGVGVVPVTDWFAGRGVVIVPLEHYPLDPALVERADDLVIAISTGQVDAARN